MSVLRLLKYLVVIVIVAAVTTQVGRQATRGWGATVPGPAARPSARPDGASRNQPTLPVAPGARDANPATVAGSDTAQARAVQLSLVKCGVLPRHQVDGRLGLTTISAIKTLQYSANLQPDGIYGPLTRQVAQQCNSRQSHG